LTLRAAARAIRDGATSSTAYTRSLLDRIAATDAEVQAWAYLDREAALRAAVACDASGPAGPLAGVGIGVKDIIATTGQPTQMGSPIYAGARPARDAECVARLERAGGFVLGKTVTTEFAFMQPGKTRNPWNPGHTPGGSSSGSAAAVALGQVPAALGTQTNGSVIRPAAFCGVVGFKPTAAALPFAGVAQFSPTLDTLGVFTRNVADCALLAACLSEAGRIAGELATLERPPRLAFLAEFPWTPVGSVQQRELAAALGRLESAGAMVTAVVLPDAWREAHLTLRTIMLCEAARQLGELQARERARMSAKLNAALDEGRSTDDGAYRAALSRRESLIAAASEWMAPFDAIVCAPATGPAPADLAQTGDPSYCTLWSLLACPAISLPIGLSGEGLPLGMQLASFAGSDDMLLAVAGWCEERIAFRGKLVREPDPDA
jgi:amidase